MGYVGDNWQPTINKMEQFLSPWDSLKGQQLSQWGYYLMILKHFFIKFLLNLRIFVRIVWISIFSDHNFVVNKQQHIYYISGILENIILKLNWIFIFFYLEIARSQLKKCILFPSDRITSKPYDKTIIRLLSVIPAFRLSLS